jgi:hypothetical protein
LNTDEDQFSCGYPTTVLQRSTIIEGFDLDKVRPEEKVTSAMQE